MRPIGLIFLLRRSAVASAFSFAFEGFGFERRKHFERHDGTLAGVQLSNLDT